MFSTIWLSICRSNYERCYASAAPRRPRRRPRRVGRARRPRRGRLCTDLNSVCNAFPFRGYSTVYNLKYLYVQVCTFIPQIPVHCTLGLHSTWEHSTTYVEGNKGIMLIFWKYSTKIAWEAQRTDWRPMQKTTAPKYWPIIDQTAIAKNFHRLYKLNFSSGASTVIVKCESCIVKKNCVS